MGTKGYIRASSDSWKGTKALELAIESLKDSPARLSEQYLRELCERGQVERTLIRRARRLAKNRPDLVVQVQTGLLSLYRAEEVMLKGVRQKCPACEGRGHIFVTVTNENSHR